MVDLPSMDRPLERIYHEHHTKRRGDFFLVNGKVRGAFLAERVGKGKKVLDIGCRDGALTRSYVEGNTVTGMDIDSAALERAQGALKIKTVHADLNGEWPVGHDFDVVVACEIIEHLYYPDQVLKKIAAVLVANGLLLGSIPHAFALQCRARYLFGSKKSTPLQDPTHINHFSAKELRNVLEAAGFRDIHIEGIVSKKFSLFARLFPYAFAHSFMFSARRPV